ncbi:MAG: hypothetical protein ACK4WJ_03810 [Endomicrobiia bacterium]
MKYIVKVTTKIKNDILLSQIKSLGYKNIDGVSSSKLYLFKGNISKDTIFYITKVLLVDPVIEEYQILSKFKKEKDKTVINIWNKPQVLDVVAIYVLKGIRYLGIEENVEVHTGTQLCILPQQNEIKIKSIVEKIFMNPLIQYYEII